MKTKFKKQLSPEVALEIAQGIIEAACMVALEDTAQRKSCRCRGLCGCDQAASRIDRESIKIKPNYNSGWNSVFFPAADTVGIRCQTCSGNEHTFTINVGNGECEITHSGARRSIPGIGLGLIPMTSPFWEVNQATDWEMVSYETSEPTWAAVAGFLRGRVGDGPSDQEEADHRRLAEAEADLRKKAQAAGRVLPVIHADFEGDKIVFLSPDRGGYPRPWKPAWTGVEYRRAAANGVAL